MDLNKLKEAIEIAKMLDDAPTQAQGDGRKVIVRSRDAGVIYGEYAGSEGSTIHIRNGVQMWKWFAAKGHTLIDVATHGVDADKCKLSPSSATVTVFNACALIDVTEAAAKSIEGAA